MSSDYLDGKPVQAGASADVLIQGAEEKELPAAAVVCVGDVQFYESDPSAVSGGKEGRRRSVFDLKGLLIVVCGQISLAFR